MLFTFYFYSAPVHNNGISGDGKAKARAADLSGMGFVHPVKSLKYPVNALLRDSNAGVRNRHIKIFFMIRIPDFESDAA